MEIALDSRLSVAGTATTAVEQMNTREKAHFVSICNQQRKELYSLIAWEFRYVSRLVSIYLLCLVSIIFHSIFAKI